MRFYFNIAISYQLASVSHLFQQYCNDGMQGCSSDTLQRSYAVFYSLTLRSFVYTLVYYRCHACHLFPQEEDLWRPRVESILNFNWLPLCLHTDTRSGRHYPLKALITNCFLVSKHQTDVWESEWKEVCMCEGVWESKEDSKHVCYLEQSRASPFLLTVKRLWLFSRQPYMWRPRRLSKSPHFYWLFDVLSFGVSHCPACSLSATEYKGINIY